MTVDASAKLALKISGVSKTFGRTRVLKDLDLEVKAGEVIGLCGQNGSGKSTLIKVLTGYHAPDPGAEIEAWGVKLTPPVQHPLDHGIAVIHQELGLVDTMTVTENLGVSLSYGTSGVRPVRWRSERREAARFLERFNVAISPDAMVGTLGASDRAVIAVLRTVRQLEQRGRDYLLILDEPLAYLSRTQSLHLLDLVKQISANGSSVILVSHNLDEALGAATRIVVLRDGSITADVDAASVEKRQVVSYMLGREFSTFYPELPNSTRDKVVLRAENVSGRTVKDVSFELRAGEILGVTGLEGAGHDELARLLGRVEPVLDGAIVDGEGRAGGPGPAGALADGIVLVPGNRLRDGLWGEATVAENVTLPVLDRYFQAGFLRHRGELRDTLDLMRTFVVQPARPTNEITQFSGGNQQKVMLAKWLNLSPRVLLLDEPTRGVDAGARHDILEIVNKAASEGAAVVMCSSDLEQIAQTCHRALVLSRGQLVSEIHRQQLSEEALLGACYRLGDPAAANPS